MKGKVQDGDEKKFKWKPEWEKWNNNKSYCFQNETIKTAIWSR